MQGIFFTIIISFIFSFTSIAQEQNYMDNQFLIQLRPNQEIDQLIFKLKHYNDNITWKSPKRLIPKMDLWLLEYGSGNLSNQISKQTRQTKLLDFLSNLSIIQTAQYNHKIKLRSPAPNSTAPNDPFFSNQWQYVNTGAGGGTAGVDLDADLAWDITTGGLTASNDTIVVAILDNGISPSQNDFGDNIWRNYAEIPGNNIDDDNNGYKDDFLGWNSTSNSDLIAGGGHGTSVAGIVGAKGNNSNGVSGVNWNVKLMIIKNDWNTSEAKVLVAYGYALTQRRIYNQTNGQEGAYVVATNASWGQDFGKPADAPLWCAFYDTLGAYGILNIAATANSNVDVDAVGDLPTACPSDYLVAVTNVNKLGYKELGAAFGSTSIDLGSFGSGVYTTISPSGFGTFGGTSAATPHVAGAVALLYSGVCNNFMTYSKIFPDSAALKMKEYLMNGVVPIIDLNGTSVSGGYLNLFNSLNLSINDCPTSCFVPYQISGTNILDTAVHINWSVATSTNQVSYRYRPIGTPWSSFSTLALGQNNISLNNLTACTNYEVQLLSVCNTINSDTTTFSLQTNGCCTAPIGLTTNTIDNDSTYLTWQPLFASTNYIVSYKEDGAANWQNSTNITSTNFWLSNLTPCRYYDVAIKSICTNGDTTSYSDTLHFATLGCTTCNILSYCNVTGDNSSDDWIDTFSVDNYIFSSGNDSGYALFDSIVIQLRKGDFHAMSISQGKTYTEFVRIWLDINQDGDFSDPNEEIFNRVMSTVEKTINGSFIVPATSLLGITRMRVAMRWNNYAEDCINPPFGEIEDYCVQITEGNSINQLANSISELSIFPNPFSDKISLQLSLIKKTDLELSIYSITGQLVHNQRLTNRPLGQQTIVLEPKIPNGMYLLQIKNNEGQVTKRMVKM
jgi:serine protease